jgi:hypothetical protein
MTDLLGFTGAALTLWMPTGYGHDEYEWATDRWLRVDPIDDQLEYLVNLDAFSREGRWSLQDHETAMDDMRIAYQDEDLLWTFSAMAEIAKELRIGCLTDEVAEYYAGDPELDALLASAPRWAPLGG